VASLKRWLSSFDPDSSHPDPGSSQADFASSQREGWLKDEEDEEDGVGVVSRSTESVALLLPASNALPIVLMCMVKSRGKMGERVE